jgi:hypothetical protein
MITDWMNKVAAKVGITKKDQNYGYRHSMATIPKRPRTNTSFIQEVLGALYNCFTISGQFHY